MPFYDDKLVSPLSIRFTQNRIREIFQDGRKVEDTIRQIKAGPGIGDYDIVLEVPFPNIEIIRWTPNGRYSGSRGHWFSYDNRRLYCLQRVAASYWPKRVGVIVEVQYSDQGGQIRKKLDTQTEGHCVSIGHAFATAAELEEWSWRKATTKAGRKGKPSKQELAAEAALAADDAKESVEDLTNARPMTAFERLMAAEAAQLQETSSQQAVQESSTQPVSMRKQAVAEPPEVAPARLVSPATPSVSHERALDGSASTLSNLIGQLLAQETAKASTAEASTAEPGVQSGDAADVAKDMPGEDMPESSCAAKQAEIFAAEPPVAPESSSAVSPAKESLTDLIGQLLLAADAEASSTEAPQETFPKPESMEQNKDDSLNGLIGQLLALNPKEAAQVSEHASEAASTCVPDRTDSEGSTPVDTSRQSLSGDSDKADLSSPSTSSSKSVKKAAQKEPPDAKSLKGQAARAAKLQQAQMAQWQVAAAHMQMAQWQQAQFAAAQYQQAMAAQWGGYH